MQSKLKLSDSKAEVLKKIFQRTRLAPGDPHRSLLVFGARKCLCLTSPSIIFKT